MTGMPVAIGFQIGGLHHKCLLTTTIFELRTKWMSLGSLPTYLNIKATIQIWSFAPKSDLLSLLMWTRTINCD